MKLLSEACIMATSKSEETTRGSLSGKADLSVRRMLRLAER